MKEVYLFLSLRCVGGGCESEGILSHGHPGCRRPIPSTMQQATDSQQIQNESQESPRSTIIQRTAHDHNFSFENKENIRNFPQTLINTSSHFRTWMVNLHLKVNYNYKHLTFFKTHAFIIHKKAFLCCPYIDKYQQ